MEFQHQKSDARVTCDVRYLCANFSLLNLPVLDLGPMYSTDVRRRAVASIGKAEGHQHSAGGHGVDANKCIPSRRGGPEFFWYIFNTNSCILMHCLAPKMGITSVFINRPLRIGGMKTFGRCCPMRPGGPKIEAKSRERGGILGVRQ